MYFCHISLHIYAAPSAPLNLTFPPGGVLNDSITLTWFPPENPSGVIRFYQFKLSSSTGAIFVNTTDNTTTMVMLSDLVPATQYNISARAFTIVFGPFSDQLNLFTADGEEIDPIYVLCNCEIWMLYSEESELSFLSFSTFDASECHSHQHWFHQHISELDRACCVFS